MDLVSHGFTSDFVISLIIMIVHLPAPKELHPQQSEDQDEEEEQEEQAYDGFHGAHERHHQVPQRRPVPKTNQQGESPREPFL